MKTKVTSESTKLPPGPKAYEVLQARKWAPIAFARNDKGYGVKPEVLANADVLSMYAALCVAYPSVEVRGHLINRIKAQIDWITVGEWESKPGRTVEEVIALLKKVEG